MSTSAPSTVSPRVGIVVTDDYAPEDPDHDTPLLLDALRERGAVPEAVVWHQEADLSRYDLLVLRSPWDYPERIDEFTAWLDRAATASRLENSLEVVHWNLDKRYLDDLARVGAAVVPTVYAATAAEVSNALRAHAGRVVLKPAVSAGARDTGLFEADDPAATDLAERILASGGVIMVQPEVPELTAGDEKALYLIDGRLTHAVAKGALLAAGGGLIGGVYIEHPEIVPVTARERTFADAVLAAVASVTGAPTPLYARIDVVDSAAHGLVVLEVELIEPALNLHLVPDVAPLVADAILRRVPATSPAAPSL